MGFTVQEKQQRTFPSLSDEWSVSPSSKSICMADSDFCQFGVIFLLHVNEVVVILVFFRLRPGDWNDCFEALNAKELHCGHLSCRGGLEK